MTIEDGPADKSVDAVGQTPNHGGDLVERQDVDPGPDDILRQLSSALLDGGEASDTVSLALLAGMSGPLPPPQMLRDYDHTIPEGANRIMVMAETAQAALISDRQESRRAERRGQFFAFICVLATLVTGIILAVVGREILGFSFSGVGLAAMVYAFVRGRG